MKPEVESDANVIEQSALGSCLMPLLKALRWHGNRRQLAESLPHYTQIYSPSMFVEVMQHLDYTSELVEISLNDLDVRLLPCLFVAETGAMMVVLEKKDSHCVVFDGEKNERSTYPIGDTAVPVDGMAYVFKKQTSREKKLKVEKGWLRKTFDENKKLIYSAIFLSFFINVFALATPIFIMATYDKVVGASSKTMLAEFSVGIALAFAGYYILYRMRSKLLAVVGARFDRAIGNNIFERLLYLAPVYTESATVGSQVARIKDFDRLREFLTGPMVTVFFDLPFIFIALSLIAIIGGTLILIPGLLIVVFFILGLIMRMKVKRRIKESGLCGSQQQEFMLEAIKNVRPLKYMSAEKKWETRFRDYSAAVSMANFKTTVLGSVNSAISDVLMIGSGMAVLSFGALKVIDQTISVGGMIAVMILIWRVLAPLKTLFNILPRLQQVESSVRQISRLMSIPPETQPMESKIVKRRTVRGNVIFNRVSLRYRSTFDPALVGVTFEVKPGELVGIVGRNGSGKTTLLKVLLGLYQPQAGSVRIDNQDIRQLNPIELRNSIAYLPQIPELFYGSIATNLMMAEPDATEEEMKRAAEMAGVLKEIENLPEGFNTELKDYSSVKLAGSFRQKLCLARAYLKQASIMVLDEPANMLDDAADAQLMKTLKELHGKVTILMVTHRPSHLKQVDKILLLEQGQLVLQGPPKDIFPKIPRDLL